MTLFINTSCIWGSSSSRRSCCCRGCGCCCRCWRCCRLKAGCGVLTSAWISAPLSLDTRWFSLDRKWLSLDKRKLSLDEGMFSLDTRRFSLEARSCLSSYVVDLAELHHCVPDKTPSCRCTRVQETNIKLKDNGLSPDQIRILSPCSRLSSSIAGTLVMLGPEGHLFHRHARTWRGRLWRWMRSEDGSHEFWSFPLKKEIVTPFPSMWCILVLQEKLGPKSLSFENINIGSNLYLNLTCNPHILGRAGIIATPRLVVTAARCLVSAWRSVVSSASCRFGVFNTFYRFSLSPLSLFHIYFHFLLLAFFVSFPFWGKPAKAGLLPQVPPPGAGDGGEAVAPTWS